MLLNSIRRGRDGEVSDAPAAVAVRVRGGYLPATIHADADQPLRLAFRREESSPCSEQVIFPAFGKSAILPEGKTVVVDLPPAKAGEYEFTCGMGMLRGTLVLRAPARP